MQPIRNSLAAFRRRSCQRAILAGSMFALLGLHLAKAASQTWIGNDSNGLWSSGGNWVSGSSPGSTSETTSTDVATFSAAIANTWGNAVGNPIVIDSTTQNIGGISFDTAAGNYFIGGTLGGAAAGGNALLLSSGGIIQILSTLTATNAIETINAPLVIEGAGGSYTFANNSANGTGDGAGSLDFGGIIAGGAAGATVLTLSGSNTNANTISGTVANGTATSLGINKSGAGSWVLTGTNSYTGGMTIGAGTLQIGGLGSLGGGAYAGAISDSGALEYSSTAAQTFSGIISGAGIVEKDTTSSTLTLSGANTYTGTTTLNDGTLNVGIADVPGVSGALGNGGPIIFSGGALQYSAANQQDYSSRIVNSTAAILVDTNGQNVAYATALANTNTGGLTKVGLGALILSGANTYTGGTTVSGGTLQLVGGGSISGSTVTVGNNSGDNGTLSVTGGSVSSVYGYLGYNAGSSGTVTVSGGTWTISNPLSVGYNGAIYVGYSGSGILNITCSGVVGSIGPNTLIIADNVGSNGTLNLGTGGSAGALLTTGVFGGSGTAVVNFNQTGGYSFTPELLGSLSVNKLGAGTTVLFDTGNYTGTTTISAGELIAAYAGALSPSAGGAVTVAAGAGLGYDPQFNLPMGLNSTLSVTGGAHTVLGGAIGSSATSAEITVTAAATATGSVQVNIYGISGVAPLAGTNTYTLLTGGAGSSLNGATYSLGTVYDNTNFIVGPLSAAATCLQVTATSATALTSAYWVGGLAGATNVLSASNGTTASNWATTPGGAVQALIPGAYAYVTISANSPVTAPGATVLGANMGIAGLTIADTVNGLGLNADGFSLTIGAGGIAMNAHVPASTIAANVVLISDQTWTNDSANALTVSGVVSSGGNAVTLTKGGAGTLILSGINTYAGVTILTAGTLNLSNQLTLAQNTVTMNGGNLVFDQSVRSDAFTLGGLTSAGAGSDYNIALQNNAADRAAITLSIGYPTGFFNADLNYAGVFSGAGSLTKFGTSTLTLSGANTYTGTTALNGGTLNVAVADVPGVSGALGNGGPITFSGGSLQYSAANQQDYSGRIVNSTAAILVDTNGQSVAYAIALANTNTGGLTKVGLGTLTLSGANTYTGATTVNAGTLALAFGAVSTNILPSASALVLGEGALVLSGTGTQTVNGLRTSASTGSDIVLGANETLTLGALTSAGTNSALNFNTAAGGANATTSVVGTGLIVLTGRTAGNAINVGFTLTDAGGFGLATVNASHQVIRLTTTALLPISGAGSTTNYRINNNAGGATIAGSSTLAVSSSESAKSITVDTTAASGLLTLDSGAVLGNNTWNFGGDGSNTYQITGSASGAGLTAVAAGNAININNDNVGPVTLGSPILASGTNLVSLYGSGTLILTAVNTYSGGTTISGGALQVASGGSITGANVIVGNNSVNCSLSVNGGSISSANGYLGYNAGASGTATVSSGFWANTSGLYVGNSGTGVLNVTGGNISSDGGYIGYNIGSSGTATVSGGNWTNSGGLFVGDSGAGILNLTGGTISSDGGEIGANDTASGTATVRSGTWINSGGLYVGLGGIGVLNLTGGAVSNTSGYLGTSGDSCGTVAVSGGTWTNTGPLFIGGSGAGVFNLISGNVSSAVAIVGFDTGSVGTVTVGGGTWINSGALYVGSSGSGMLTITGSGIVTVGASGGGTITIANSFNSAGTLNLGTGGAAGTLNASVVTGGSGTAVVNFNHTGSYTFAPQLTGSLSVNKLGRGTTTLSTNNTYTGATTVSQGTMLVSGSISGSMTTVSGAGSTLGGIGTAGGVIVGDGAILEGGDGSGPSGALTSAGPISLTSGSAVELTLGPSGTNSSLIRAGGAWSFASNQTLVFNLDAGAGPGTYDNLISGLSGSEPGLATVSNWTISNPGVIGSFTYDGAGDVDLALSAIPEPCTAALLLAGVSLLGFRRRRTRQ